MKLFESKQVIDMDPYIIVFHIRALVLNSFKILVKHMPYWYLKDPPMPRPKEFGLVDAPTESVVPYPSPPTLSAKSSRVSMENGVIDHTSDIEEDDEWIGSSLSFSFSVSYFDVLVKTF